MGNPIESPSSPRPSSQLTAENYAYLVDHVYRESGIVLDDTKRYLVEARLVPLVLRERLGSLDDLCNLMRATQGTPLRRHVVEAMTTNETLFFRDTPAFDALRNTLLPELVAARRSQRSLSIWSAAASSGQEAYSLAMMLCELD